MRIENLQIMNLKFRKRNRGNTILLVTGVIVIGLGLLVAFLSRSNSLRKDSQNAYESLDTYYTMETALEEAEAKLDRGISNISLNGKLHFAGGPTSESFNSLSNEYVDAGGDVDNGKALALDFLKEAVEAQSYDSLGNQDSSSEFAHFDCSGGATSCAYPADWKDPDPLDNNFFEVKYSFFPRPTQMSISPTYILFEYEYLVQVRAYGQSSYGKMQSEISGVISIPLQNAPFSRWATILNSLQNQNGQTLVFAGGNTSNEFQEIYNGPVHVNSAGNFYGHPIFNSEFSSAAAFSSWRFWDTASYSGCYEKYGGSRTHCFNGGYSESVDSVSYPTELFNTLRLAAGDTSATAATNTSPVAELDLVSLLQENNEGSLGSISTVPDGIYIPLDNQISKNVEGGIFVRGDAQIQLDVITDPSTEISSSYMTNISGNTQYCRFQKFYVYNTDSGQKRDIFVGDKPVSGAPGGVTDADCDYTYVFDNNAPTDAPAVLSGKLGGNIYVDGKIDELGGASRSRPSVTKDFQYHITATKDIRIKNDLQYEDAKYYEFQSDHTMGSTVVADAYGEVASSGVTNTDEDLGVGIDSDSTTILGLSSLYRSVFIHIDAPTNLNLHMALYAGNSNYYDSSTGYGCNANNASKKGCGWGVEGWNTKPDSGSLKIFGSIAEYKDQTTGMLSSPPTGYESLFSYDTRLLSSLQPPGFPISNDLNAYPVIKKFKAWRLSQN